MSLLFAKVWSGIKEKKDRAVAGGSYAVSEEELPL